MRRLIFALILLHLGLYTTRASEQNCTTSFSRITNIPVQEVPSELVPGQTYTFKSKRGNYYTGVFLGFKTGEKEIRFRPTGESAESSLVIDRLDLGLVRLGKSVPELHGFTPQDLVSVTSIRGNERRGSVLRFSDDGSLVFFLPEGKENKPENVIALNTNQLNLGLSRRIGTVPIRGPPERPPVQALAKRGLEPQEITLAGKKIQHFGESPEEHLDLIKKNGLEFNLETKVRNATYRMTEPFDLGDGRIVVLALVEPGDGKSYLRTFYRSNSQGEFRLLPATNKKVIGMPGFDKGETESTLVLPLAVQSLLANRKGGKKLASTAEAEALAFGAVRRNVGFDAYLDYYGHPSYIGKAVTKNRIVTGEADGREFLRPPDKDQIADKENKPDFSKVVSKYTAVSSLAGEVEALVYHSANGKIEYTVFKDKEGKIWFQTPTDLAARINNYGVGSTSIDIGNLGKPRWEYDSQVDPAYHGNRHPTNRDYVDSWKYLREMPTIKDWYKSQGLEVPN